MPEKRIWIWISYKDQEIQNTDLILRNCVYYILRFKSTNLTYDHDIDKSFFTLLSNFKRNTVFFNLFWFAALSKSLKKIGGTPNWL